jgi:hypothetical protein
VGKRGSEPWPRSTLCYDATFSIWSVRIASDPFDAMKARILLTGKNGQLGWELERMLDASSELKSLDRGDLDLREPASIRKAIRNFQPQIILNAAAYTAVDKAETEEALARAINAEAPPVMAEEAQKAGARGYGYFAEFMGHGRSSAFLQWSRIRSTFRQASPTDSWP